LFGIWKETAMQAAIDRDGCISCGMCVSLCPKVFRMGEDDRAEVYVKEIPPEEEDAAREAERSCPVEVISICE